MKPSEEFPHYFRDVSHLKTIDVYRIIDLFGVTNPCDQHALKKILAGGKRGAKDTIKDTKEAIVTLRRKLEMLEEDQLTEAQVFANAHAEHVECLRDVVQDATADQRVGLQQETHGFTEVTVGNVTCLAGPWIENPGHMPVTGMTSVQVKTRTKVLPDIRTAHSLGWANRDAFGPSITHYRLVK